MSFFLNKLRVLKARYNEAYFPYRKYHRKNNCVFIHIPKVAGTSILDALGKKGGSRDHLPWYVYYTANTIYFKKSFKFAFVRNPWDRAFSAYRYLAQGGNKNGDMVIAEKVRSYKDFESFVVDGLGAGHFRNHLLFIPQSEFIVNGNGDIVVDYLGRYECIEEDFSFVAKKLCIPIDLPRKNSSNIAEKDYKKFYLSTKSVSVIEEIYRQDLLLFNYSYSSFGVDGEEKKYINPLK